jgi:hypothetical protein
MTFLSGKTTSYTRWLSDLPDLPKALDYLLGEVSFRPISEGEHRLEALGSCSWRNLLDGPVDRGYLDGDPDLYGVGLRRDVKRAPGQLVKAEAARAVADYLQTCGGKPSKARIREIGAEVRMELNLQAKPKPAHGIAVVDVPRGLVLLDGPPGVHGWLAGALRLRPLYEAAPARFLEWLVWAGLHEDHPQGHSHCWPVREAVFRNAGGDGFALQGESSDGLQEVLEKALANHMALQSARFMLVLGDDAVSLTLNRAWLKVTALEFPDGCGKTGPLETRLLERMGVIREVERALGDLVLEFLAHEKAGTLAPEFLALLSASEDEEIPEVANGWDELIATTKRWDQEMYDRIQALLVEGGNGR